jgi:hypothetical protein
MHATKPRPHPPAASRICKCCRKEQVRSYLRDKCESCEVAEQWRLWQFARTLSKRKRTTEIRG